MTRASAPGTVCPEADPRPSAALARIRVVLADDHALMRRSLRLLLDDEEGVQVIAEAEDMAAAVRHVQTTNRTCWCLI